MKRILAISALLAAVGVAGAASAATNTAQVGPFAVTGNVPSLCSGGTVVGGNSVFALGTLIDTGTGLLLTSLSAPNKTVTGAFCNSASTITIAATPMVAQSFTGTPPTGFTDAVDYTATASGWTPTAASFITDAASNPNAIQDRTTAFTGVITVGVSSFSPVGGTALRMVSDPDYQGSITITLAVAA